MTRFFARDSLNKGRNNPTDVFAIESQGCTDFLLLNESYGLRNRLFGSALPVLEPSSGLFLLPSKELSKIKSAVDNIDDDLTLDKPIVTPNLEERAQESARGVNYKNAVDFLSRRCGKFAATLGFSKPEHAVFKSMLKLRNYIVSSWESFAVDWEKQIGGGIGVTGIFRKTVGDLRSHYEVIMSSRDIRVIQSNVNAASVFGDEDLLVIKDILKEDEWDGCKFDFDDLSRLTELFNERSEEKYREKGETYQLRLPEEFLNLQRFQKLTFSDGPRRLLEQTIAGRNNRFVEEQVLFYLIPLG
jgi:hypothetical protein